MNKWEQTVNDNKLINKEIHDYLSMTHQGVQLGVYCHRWRGYIKEKKQPHYDTLKYRFLLREVERDNKLLKAKPSNLTVTCRECRREIGKQTVKVNEPKPINNRGRTVFNNSTYGLY